MKYSVSWASMVWVGIAALTLCGCSSEGNKKRPPMAKVKGTVTYNGNPVAGAVVNFTMENTPRGASGTTDDNGNFKLTTYDTNDGAFVGIHKVTVTKPNLTPYGKPPTELTPEDLLKITREGKLQEMSKPPKAEIPAKYTDLKTTPLQYTIEAGENEKAIELED